MYGYNCLIDVIILWAELGSIIIRDHKQSSSKPSLAPSSRTSSISWKSTPINITFTDPTLCMLGPFELTSQSTIRKQRHNRSRHMFGRTILAYFSTKSHTFHEMTELSHINHLHVLNYFDTDNPSLIFTHLMSIGDASKNQGI